MSNPETHTLRVHFGWEDVEVSVECPYYPRQSPDSLHGPCLMYEDWPGTSKPMDECGVQHYLDADGLRAVATEIYAIHLPVQVRWEDDHPVLRG